MKNENTLIQNIEKVFNEVHRPLHYKEVTQLVNQKVSILGKTPDMTIVARLSENKRFKRVGKGIYALNSWDEYKPYRFAKDIAYDILKNAVRPMNIVDLVNRVKAERYFKSGSFFITQCIVNDDRFDYEPEKKMVRLVEWNNKVQ